VPFSNWTKSEIEITNRQIAADIGHLASLLAGLDETNECLKRAERVLFEARELIMRLGSEICPA
jgi:hypothetical protein